jgi:hypothetical protein
MNGNDKGGRDRWRKSEHPLFRFPSPSASGCGPGPSACTPPKPETQAYRGETPETRGPACVHARTRIPRLKPKPRPRGSPCPRTNRNILSRTETSIPAPNPSRRRCRPPSLGLPYSPNFVIHSERGQDETGAFSAFFRTRALPCPISVYTSVYKCIQVDTKLPLHFMRCSE